MDPYNLSFTPFLDHWMFKCRIIYVHAQYTIYCYQSITTWKLQYENLIFQDNTDNSRPIPGFLGWVWTLQGLQSSEGRFSTIPRHQTISLKWVRKPTKKEEASRTKPLFHYITRNSMMTRHPHQSPHSFWCAKSYKHNYIPDQLRLKGAITKGHHSILTV